MVLIGLIFSIEYLLRVSANVRKIDDIPYVTVNGLRVFIPNQDRIVTGGAFVPIHVKTNSEGYASPEYAVPKPANTKRVVILGNSFTRGFEVDYDQKFSSLTEKYLRDLNPNIKYEVMNFGIGGYSLIDQMFVYERYVKKYKPDVVILVTYLPMDFATTKIFLPDQTYLQKTPVQELSGERLLAQEPTYTSQGRSEWEITKFCRRILAGVTEKIHHLTLTSSGQLGTAVSWLYEHWLSLGLIDAPAVQAVTVSDGEENYFNPNDQGRAEIRQFTAEMVVKLGQAVKQDGVEFRTVVIPSHWEVDGKYAKQFTDSFPRGYNPALPTQGLKQVVDGAFPVLDLAESIAPAINQDKVQVFIRDTGHFTAAGHDLVAKTIVDFLKNSPILQLPTTP